MPANSPQTRSDSLFFRNVPTPDRVKKAGGKSRLCVRFILSDCPNTAVLGLVLNGGRIGPGLDPESVNPGVI
jgi:hypothetical protein